MLCAENDGLTIRRRITASMLAAIPPEIQHFDGRLYLVVKRKPDKDVVDHPFGVDVRIDPCEFDWDSKTITLHIPFKINHGIATIADLATGFYDGIEAAFLMLMKSCLP
jgi:hypothetical protein